MQQIAKEERQAKKAYTSPRIVELGNIGQVTQVGYPGSCGSNSLVRPA